MSLSTSNPPLHRTVASVLSLLLIAFAFYCAQNIFGAPGGRIAFVKLLWLFLVILFWFLFPALFRSDRRLSASIRWMSSVFLVNMLLRGGIELWMMFVSHSWRPVYGIAHDLFSIALIAVLLLFCPPRSSLDVVARKFFVVMLGMFAFESYFAWYMRTGVQTRLGAEVYFVPNLPEYTSVLQVTWVAVVFGFLSCFLLTKRWLNETPAL